jgi:hypothetical protein
MIPVATLTKPYLPVVPDGCSIGVCDSDIPSYQLSGFSSFPADPAIHCANHPQKMVTFQQIASHYDFLQATLSLQKEAKWLNFA